MADWDRLARTVKHVRENEFAWDEVLPWVEKWEPVGDEMEFEKVCSLCRELKAPTEFSPDPARGDGRDPRCKMCMAARRRDRRKLGLEHRREKKERDWTEFREFLKGI